MLIFNFLTIDKNNKLCYIITVLIDIVQLINLRRCGMFQLDFKSGVPICDQIVNGFIKLKALGVIKSGDQLPSVRSLASKFSVNPNTVQKSYTMLELGGIIYSVKGKGSFVSDDDNAANAILKSAKQDFIAAIQHANELGLTVDEMIKLVKETTTKEETAQ